MSDNCFRVDGLMIKGIRPSHELAYNGIGGLDTPAGRDPVVGFRPGLFSAEFAAVLERRGNEAHVLCKITQMKPPLPNNIAPRP